VRGAAVVALALLARVGAAQAPTRSSAIEVRIDGILGRDVVTAHAGLGLIRPASRNFEVQLVLGGGMTRRDTQDETRASARADILARFAPPPATRDAWSAYAAGGVGGLFERGVTGRGVIIVLIGARGRRTFVEAGLGGGLRAGGGLRF
jgi:hypothetical protein